MKAFLRKRAAAEGGATMVEFALVSTVAFMLMLGLGELSLVVLGNSTGSNAARDGARVGVINYIDANDTTSSNYALIRAAVQKRLANNVTNLGVTVTCYNGNSAPATALADCSTTNVDLVRGDLIEVKATWNHKGFGPFMPTVSQKSIARMVIGGKPDLTTVTSPSTTTTLAPTTTTTVAASKYSISSLDMKDTNTDGIVDRVDATFSGTGSLANCTNTSMWTLVNAPSGGTLQSVSVASNVATLTLNGSTKNTANTGFTIAFAPTGSCTGANSFSASTPNDAAGPVPISMIDTADGSTDGTPEANDTYSVTFSETVSPTWTSGSTVSVTYTRGSSPSDTSSVSIPDLVDSSFDTGGKYNATGTTVTFDRSTVTASGTTVSVKLGCSGSCPSMINDKGLFSYTPSTTIRDLAGNSAAGSLSSGNNYKLF